MKKSVTLLLFFLVCSLGFGQSSGDGNERVSPTYGEEIQRRVSVLRIVEDGHDNIWRDALVVLKSNTPDYFFTDKGNVKVQVTVPMPEGEKVVFKKKFKDSYLYIFRSGQIQVGKPNFDKLVITPKKDGLTYGEINEKEGVY